MTVDDLVAEQDGVVSREQVLALGHDDAYIERRLRRKDWARVHRGIYVNHTGPVTWIQRVWAALLYAWPAAAADSTALALHGLLAPTTRDLIHIAVADDRRLAGLPGVRIHLISGLDRHLQPNRHPPRLRLEMAVLRHASRAFDEARSVAVLADACRSRRTTHERLREALLALPKLPRRRFLLAVLDDVSEGVCSVLEHRYMSRVERSHGLPKGTRQRQVRQGRRSIYRDVDYLGGRVIAELDGRLGHDKVEDRWADLERDIDSAVTGAITVRLGWAHVLSPCRAARVMIRLLHFAGWTGTPRPCGTGCTAVGVMVA